MKILAVETATALQSVALLDDETVVASSTEDACGSHAKRLIPAIDRLLVANGWTLASLDALAVSIGPGSFTGLRVGLATMLGFRSVTGLPLVAVPTLEGLCWNMYRAEQPVCPMIRSRTGEVYWALCRWRPGGQLGCLGDERVGTLECLVQDIKGPTLVLGDGWLANREEIWRLLGSRMTDALEAPAENMQASAVSVGLAGLERLRQGGVAGKVVTPRYVQRAEAEIVFDRRTESAAEGTSVKVGKS